MPNRPCLVCGKPTPRTRCPQHQIVRDRNLAGRHLNGAYLQAGGICSICNKWMPRHQATLDHILPLSRGGTDHPTNLRLAHRSCNSARGATN